MVHKFLLNNDKYSKNQVANIQKTPYGTEQADIMNLIREQLAIRSKNKISAQLDQTIIDLNNAINS